MGTLISLIEVAEMGKPAFGKACNHCGWCCLTEVCTTGQELGQSKDSIPCKFLIGEDKKQNNYNPNKHYCTLMLEIPEYKGIIGAGPQIGCDAKTQKEVMAEYIK